MVPFGAGTQIFCLHGWCEDSIHGLLTPGLLIQSLHFLPGVGRAGPSAPGAGNYTGGSYGTRGVATRKKGGVALEEPGGGQRKGRGISSGFLLFSFFIT